MLLLDVQEKSLRLVLLVLVGNHVWGLSRVVLDQPVGPRPQEHVYEVQGAMLGRVVEGGVASIVLGVDGVRVIVTFWGRGEMKKERGGKEREKERVLVHYVTSTLINGNSNQSVIDSRLFILIMHMQYYVYNKHTYYTAPCIAMTLLYCVYMCITF